MLELIRAYEEYCCPSDVRVKLLMHPEYLTISNKKTITLDFPQSQAIVANVNLTNLLEISISGMFVLRTNTGYDTSLPAFLSRTMRSYYEPSNDIVRAIDQIHFVVNTSNELHHKITTVATTASNTKVFEKRVAALEPELNKIRVMRQILCDA